MIKIENKQVYSTEGKFVHRIGTDTYFKRGAVLKGDTVADYEEADEVPPYTKSEYDAEVERLIALRYSYGKEIEVNRERDSKPEQFAAYMAYVEECKATVRANLQSNLEETITNNLPNSE